MFSVSSSVSRLFIAALLIVGVFIGVSSAGQVSLFGPKQYQRTTGKPNTYTDSFSIHGQASKGTLIVKSGGETGACRLSSAIILLNGEIVFRTRRFNQQVHILEHPVNLVSSNTIDVRLRSKPGCYLTVEVINNEPVANPQSVTTKEDIPVEIVLTGSDAEVEGLTYAVASQPSHGTLSRSPPDLIYTPDTNYNGPDTFTFTVDDGASISIPATVTILVTPVNDAPQANDDIASTAEDTRIDLDILANDTDVDGDTLSVVSLSQGAHGTVTLNIDGTCTYTPATDFNGLDTFTYTASDGNGGTDTATVTITVNPVNDAPIAIDDTAATDEDTPVTTVNVLANDTDVEGDPLMVSSFTQPANGTTVNNGDGTFTYMPNANFHGSDAFTYIVSDGNGGTDTATVTITVNAVNDSPVADAQSVTLDEDSSLPITLTGSDMDGDLITYTVVADPAHGTLSGTPPDLTYMPDADYKGPDAFTFTVNDGTIDAIPATVSITVTSVNDAPVADAGPDQAHNLPAGETAMEVTLDGTGSSDKDGTVASYVWTGSPDPDDVAQPTILLSAGTHVFTLVVTDNEGGVSAPDSVNITISGLASLSIHPSSVSLNRPEASQQLMVTGTWPDGTTQDVTSAGTGTVYASSRPDIATVSAEGLVTAGTSSGTAVITATNTGVSASVNVEVSVDVTLPVVTITAPQDGATLTSPQATVVGTIEDASPIQSAFINNHPLTLDGIHFSAQLDLVEGPNPITVTATDAYGNVGSGSVTVTYRMEAEDITPPVVTITAPQDGVELTQTPVTVTGTVQDASPIKSLMINGQPAMLTGTLFSLDLALSEGTNTITATATDNYDNTGSDTVTVTLDTTPPLLAVEPLPALTNKAQMPVNGTSEPGATIALTGGVSPASGPTDQMSGAFSLPVGLHQDTHNVLSVIASDRLGNTCAPQTLEIDQDSTPPSVVSVMPATGVTVLSPNIPCKVTFSEPVSTETVILGTSFQVMCGGMAVNGSLTLSQDHEVATFVPEDSLPLGSQVDLLVTAAIKDLAGNPMAAPFTSHFFTPQEVGASVVTGEVYDDTQGLLLAGATAKLVATNGVSVGATAPSMVTGADGLFTLEVIPGTHTILISKDGWTSVERTVEVATNASATVLDARLTPLDTKQNQVSGLTGGTATNSDGDIAIAFPEDASSSDMEAQITQISPQGLRSSLPLGWSPVVTVDFTANIGPLRHPAMLTVPLPTDVTDTGSLTAVQWDGESRGWRVLSEPVQIKDNSQVVLSMDRVAQISLILPDQGTTAPPAPQYGNLLEGASPVSYPAGITGEGVVVPAVIMAGEDAHARARAGLSLPAVLPSGTVFEAKVLETYTLRSNKEVISRPFVQDLHFYAWPEDGDPLTLSVDFPVTPSKQFALGELSLGKVDLHIREPHVTAADMVGPDGATITTAEGLDISIPPGCVARNTTLHALSVPESQFSVLIPESLTYLGGLSIDFGGVPLSCPVTVTLPPLSDAVTLPPEPYIVMARVEDFANVPSLFIAGLGQVTENRVQSLDESAGLTFSGIGQAGQYGFFLLSEPAGFLQGTVTAVSGQPSTNAIVSHGFLPFLARVDENGHYIQIGPIDNVEVIAENPITDDEGTANTTIPAANEIVTLDIAIQQTPPQVVSVIPADGSTEVPVTTSISVTFSEAVTGINTDTFQLTDPFGKSIAGHLSMTDDGTGATFFPEFRLASERTYTLNLAESIQDRAGYTLTAFTATFTTEDLTPPVCQGELSVSMPDETGFATVTGTPGTAEPNSMVYIINNTSGMVVTTSIPSGADGSFGEQILADISDEIIVTIVDASGNETTLNPGPFMDETTGAVVIGPKGGTVMGEDGIELDIPAGALPHAAVVKVEPDTEPFELPDDIQGDPELAAAFEENYEFVTAVKIDTGGVRFNYGVDLSVPAPPGTVPDTTFIVVEDEEIELGGEHYDCATDELVAYESNKMRRFKVADVATVEEVDGELRITTASPPFPGILGASVRFFAPKAAIAVVTGTVVRNVIDIQGGVTQYPVKGAVVRLSPGEVVRTYFAETKDDGMFVAIAHKTIFLDIPRQIKLQVTDPLSGITQERPMVVDLREGPFAKTYPDWNIEVAAVLRENFVLESEEKIREDVTPPTINVTLSGDTLVDNVMEEDNDLHIDINVKDNRAQNPIIEKIIINGKETYVGVPKFYQHTIHVQSGIYVIDVVAKDDAQPPNVGSLSALQMEKRVLVSTPGGTPGAVEGPPELLSYKLEYADDLHTVVDIDTTVTITFNEPIDTGTVDLSTFVVKDTTTGASVTGTFVFTNYNSTVTFIPSQSLKYGHDYEIILSGIRDTDGNPATLDPITCTTTSPEILGLYPMSDAKGLAVKDGYAFITDVNRADQTGLTVVDLSDPTIDFSALSPQALAQKVKEVNLRSDSYSSWAVATDDSHAYVLTVGKIIPNTYTLLCTLQKWNITNPLNPSKVSWTPLTSATTLSGSIPSTLVVSEGFVFVTMLGSGFKVIDATSLSTVQYAQIADYRKGLAQANDIAVLGEYAYVANVPPGHLSIVKFTDAQGVIGSEYEVIKTVKIDSNPPGTTVNAYRVKIIENFRVKNGNSGYKYLNLALVGCLEQGLAVVNVTDPANPAWLYTLDTPGRVIGLDVDKESGIMVLSDSSGGLRIINIQDFDLQDPSSTIYELGSVGSSDLGGPTKGGGIVLQDNIVYVTTTQGVRAVKISGPIMDLDIDSDNTNGIMEPDRSRKEDESEDIAGDPDRPGKVIGVNNGDTDGDGVPDFSDGYDMPWNQGSNDNASAPFVPLILALPEEVDLNKAKIRFRYSSSDPWGVVRVGDKYTPAPGHLRIWKVNGPVSRKKGLISWPLSTRGDYIEGFDPNRQDETTYSISYLGPPIPTKSRIWKFYIEGIDVSANTADQQIKVEVDPDGIGPLGFIYADVVRVTVVNVEFFDEDGNSVTTEGIGEFENFVSWRDLQIKYEITPQISDSHYNWEVDKAKPKLDPNVSYQPNDLRTGDAKDKDINKSTKTIKFKPNSSPSKPIGDKKRARPLCYELIFNKMKRFKIQQDQINTMREEYKVFGVKEAILPKYTDFSGLDQKYVYPIAYDNDKLPKGCIQEIYDAIDLQFSGKIVLTSSYRNPYRNNAVDGVISSRHMWAGAIDIKPFDKDNRRKLHDAIRKTSYRLVVEIKKWDDNNNIVSGKYQYYKINDEYQNVEVWDVDKQALKVYKGTPETLNSDLANYFHTFHVADGASNDVSGIGKCN